MPANDSSSTERYHVHLQDRVMGPFEWGFLETMVASGVYPPDVLVQPETGEGVFPFFEARLDAAAREAGAAPAPPVHSRVSQVTFRVPMRAGRAPVAESQPPPLAPRAPLTPVQPPPLGPPSSLPSPVPLRPALQPSPPTPRVVVTGPGAAQAIPAAPASPAAEEAPLPPEVDSWKSPDSVDFAAILKHAKPSALATLYGSAPAPGAGPASPEQGEKTGADAGAAKKSSSSSSWLGGCGSILVTLLIIAVIKAAFSSSRPKKTYEYKMPPREIPTVFTRDEIEKMIPEFSAPPSLVLPEFRRENLPPAIPSTDVLPPAPKPAAAPPSEKPLLVPSAGAEAILSLLDLPNLKSSAPAPANLPTPSNSSVRVLYWSEHATAYEVPAAEYERLKEKAHFFEIEKQQLLMLIYDDTVAVGKAILNRPNAYEGTAQEIALFNERVKGINDMIARNTRFVDEFKERAEAFKKRLESVGREVDLKR